MKEIPEKKGLNLYRLSENCHFKLALESYVFRNTHNYRDSETSEPEFNSRHGLAPLSPFLASARKHWGKMRVKTTIRCFFSILLQPAYY